MKLLPTPPSTEKVRANSDDSLGHGMDAVIMLAIFLGLGWGLDTIFGTIPVFMITMTVIGSVGLFARFYYSYGRRMDRHDADRVAKLAGRPARATTGSEDLA
jgi:F0F1-type ATP synthase assembly protein I